MVVTTGKQTAADTTKKTKAKSACVFSPFVRSDGAKRAHTRAGKTSSAGGRKKLTDFNKFMQTEVARLKQENPDMPHKDRCAPASLMRVARIRAG